MDKEKGDALQKRVGGESSLQGLGQVPQECDLVTHTTVPHLTGISFRPAQVFGLHANADISYYTTAAKALWAGLVDLQPRTGAGGAGGISREELVAGVVRDIKGRLPQPFDIPLVRKAISTPTPTQVGAMRWGGIGGLAVQWGLMHGRREEERVVWKLAGAWWMQPAGALVQTRVHIRFRALLHLVHSY